jgi:hypothetical protein
MDSVFTLTPDTSQTDLTITTLTATAIIVTRTNIDGTGTIIGTITIEIMIGTATEINAPRFYDLIRQRYDMKPILYVLALAVGALTFQSCEDYPNAASRGYYHGGYYGGGGYDPGYTGSGYYGDGYYDGGGGGYYDGSGVVVSSGDREHHYRGGYSNEYYERENDHVNADRNANVNRNAQAKRNVQVNREVQAKRNVQVNRNVHDDRNARINRNENLSHR